jgi:hypothetical protein
MHANFYDKIRGFSKFHELTDPVHYTAVPDDWYVVITDVVGSTKAIEEGRYKEVNVVGAATIIAVLNNAKGFNIPYAFGGDGATLLIPSHLLQSVKDTLCAVQTRVYKMLSLDLRAGFVSVADLYREGAWLKVAKYHLSPTVTQAAFQGNALGLAEQWIKKGGGKTLICEHSDDSGLSLEGLECRWQPIENKNGIMLSLLVKVLPAHEQHAWEIYSELMQQIGAIYPDSSGAFPVKPSGMKLSFSPLAMLKEASMRTTSIIGRFAYLAAMYIQNTIGWLSFTRKKPVGTFDGEQYLSELAANTDARKFDEMLRMVMDSSFAQKEQLETLLEARHRQGQIAYGIHSSQKALMTCLVFNLSGNHIHFVDGADGGYALAAKQLKAQLAS